MKVLLVFFALVAIVNCAVILDPEEFVQNDVVKPLCNNQGTFDNLTQTCVCNDAFVGTQCERQKLPETAVFFSSFCFGVLGVDRFWTKYTGLGVAKLLVNLLSATIIGFLRVIVKSRCGTECWANWMVGGLRMAFGLVIFLWWIIDWSFILTGQFATEADGTPFMKNNLNGHGYM